MRVVRSHKPREMRGPIETFLLFSKHSSYFCCHKPREMRGPIETLDYPDCCCHRKEVTSRAKCAALLKHKFGLILRQNFYKVTSRAKCAALLKLVYVDCKSTCLLREVTSRAKCAALLKPFVSLGVKGMFIGLVTSRAKCAALLKLAFIPAIAGATPLSHKPREMRGPIETTDPVVFVSPLCGSHKPREMRGPIETC